MNRVQDEPMQEDTIKKGYLESNQITNMKD